MKKIITLTITVLMLLTLGCKKNPNAVIELPSEPEYIGLYLENADVRRIGHALNTAPTRQTIQWENPTTQYQFSMMVFSTDAVVGTTTREFTILSIAPDQTAEVLNLIGTSSVKNTWHIVAEAPASIVGKAKRMQLTASPVPNVSTSSGQNFQGFMVQE